MSIEMIAELFLTESFFFVGPNSPIDANLIGQDIREKNVSTVNAVVADSLCLFPNTWIY